MIVRVKEVALLAGKDRVKYFRLTGKIVSTPYKLPELDIIILVEFFVLYIKEG